MKKQKRKELGLTPLMLLGAVFAVATVVVMSFLMAVISSLTKNPTSLTGALSLVSLILAGAVSAFITSRVNGDGGTLIGILSSVISAFMITAIGLICKGGALTLGMPLNLLAFIGVSVIFSLLGKKRSNRKRRRY